MVGCPLLGLGFWSLRTLRKRIARQPENLLFQDPALWVRSVPAPVFPGKYSVQASTSVLERKTGAPAPASAVAIATLPAKVEAANLSHELREKRYALRRDGNPTEVQIADGSLKDLTGWVLNRSTMGLCLTSPEDLEVGSVISIRSTHYGDSGPWVLAQVRRCEAAPKGWMVGCRFVNPLPWNVLLRFG